MTVIIQNYPIHKVSFMIWYIPFLLSNLLKSNKIYFLLQVKIQHHMFLISHSVYTLLQ